MSQASLNSSGASKGGLKSYVTGFTLSIILTVIAFGLVLSGASRVATLAGILSAAVVQVFVWLHFFLHMDRSSEAHWNMLAVLFTVAILVLFVGGSLWIMHNLDYRMQ